MGQPVFEFDSEKGVFVIGLEQEEDLELLLFCPEAALALLQLVTHHPIIQIRIFLNRELIKA